jgi:hypothetical protein
MLCPNCKKEIENGSAFCEHCGTRIKKSKKGLWITLSVVFVAIIATIVVTTIHEQLTIDRNRVEQHQLELEQQLQAEREARQEAERKAELIQKGYIDLGLPSGTLWKNANEGGDYTRYTYDEAVSRFGNKLPTKQQLEELINECTWTWTGSGYKVIGPNGNSIYLPAAGYRGCDGDVYYVGMSGRYWSSTPFDSDHAWGFHFFYCEVNMDDCNRCYGRSVRLVQNL